MYPTLITERLVLRLASVDDAAACFAMRSSPEFVSAARSAAPRDLEEIRSLLDTMTQLMDANVACLWSVTLAGSGELIGEVSLFPLSPLHAGWEEWGISYALAPAHWGKGYASEAVRSVLKYATTKGIFRIKADVEPGNTASIAVLERTGFVYEALQKKKAVFNGERQDMASYVLLASDFAATLEPQAYQPPPAKRTALVLGRATLFALWLVTLLVGIAAGTIIDDH